MKHVYLNFIEELAQEMLLMEYGDFVEADDSKKWVGIGDMCGGRYELYEGPEFVGCTHSVMEAVRFIWK